LNQQWPTPEQQQIQQAQQWQDRMHH
jgi:hypothetical protein